MGVFTGWDDAQERERQRLGAVDAFAPALLDLLEASLVLELGRLVAARPGLVAFVDTAATLVAQFLPVDGVVVDVAADGLPPVRRARGLTAASPDARFPLGGDDTVAELGLYGVPAPLAATALPARVAARLGEQVATAVAAERVRRAAAAGRVAELAVALHDWRDELVLAELAEALASLPHAIGATIEVSAPGTGPPVRASAARAATGVRLERVVTPEAVAARARLAVTFASAPPQDATAATRGCLDVVADAIARADAARLELAQRECDAVTGLADRRGLGRAVASAMRRAEHRGEDAAVVSIGVPALVGARRAGGAAALDDAARVVAGALRAVAPDAYVARTGEDRFALVLGATDVLGSELAAQAALERLAGADAGHGGAGAGVAVFPLHATLADHLVKQADLACTVALGSARAPRVRVAEG